jgi:hypothetical protein
MRHLRFISRLKQLQVVSVILLTFPISHWYQQGLITEYNLLAGFTAATATTSTNWPGSVGHTHIF